MAEEKRSLLQRVKYWLFGKRKEHRSDQKDRRDELSSFLNERAEEKEEREAAAREDGD